MDHGEAPRRLRRSFSIARDMVPSLRSPLAFTFKPWCNAFKSLMRSEVSLRGTRCGPLLTLLGVSAGRFQLSVTWYQACARPPVFSFKPWAVMFPSL